MYEMFESINIEKYFNIMDKKKSILVMFNFDWLSEDLLLIQCASFIESREKSSSNILFNYVLMRSHINLFNKKHQPLPSHHPLDGLLLDI